MKNHENGIEVVEAVLSAVHRSDLHARFDPSEGETGAILIDEHVLIEEAELEESTILGPQKVPGYRIFTFQTVNNYPHAPDDVDELEIGECRNFHNATLIAVAHIMQCEAENRPFTKTELADMGLRPPEEQVA